MIFLVHYILWSGLALRVCACLYATFAPAPVVITIKFYARQRISMTLINAQAENTLGFTAIFISISCWRIIWSITFLFHLSTPFECKCIEYFVLIYFYCRAFDGTVKRQSIWIKWNFYSIRRKSIFCFELNEWMTNNSITKGVF